MVGEIHISLISRLRQHKLRDMDTCDPSGGLGLVVGPPRTIDRQEPSARGPHQQARRGELRMPPEPTAAPLAFDPDALRDRYRRERDKRLRTDGYEQYVEIDRSYAQYLEDPYAPMIQREPRQDMVDVIVIG